MITVIVPTMWRGKEIVNMLPAINDHPLVSEIILIDNDPTRKNEELCALSKVKYVTFGINIYVVPAWNYGWEHAENDKLVIINDDVLFDPVLLTALDAAITEDIGTITMEPEIVLQSSDTDQVIPSGATVDGILFKDVPDLRYKSAIVLGIHKKVYEKVPEQLLINYSDEFLFRLAIARGKQNKFAHGDFRCKTRMSTTSSLFGTIAQKEAGIYREVFNKYGI